MIKLAKSLSLPAELVTQTVGILAKRRAGKSYTARRMVEQLIAEHQQVVIVDPKGDWWGIRAHRDGRLPGLPVTILGGERGDAPLEKAGGELVAKLVVEERVTALLDLSLFRKSEVATFMTGFLEALYRLKAREQYRTPMMLVIDEADAIAPQKPQHGEERMLGAAEDIVRRGGQRGIGCTLISQRSAVLNKNVLTQVQVLIALRTIAPQDLAALKAWVDVHGSEEERRTLMAALPSLPTGDAWVWSPGWPTHDGIFERVSVLEIQTFDSGATPRPGEKRAEPKTLADVDLEALRRQMAEVVKRAEETDPKHLRARIGELERDLKHARAAAPAPSVNALEAAQQQGERAAERRASAAIAKVVASAEAGRRRTARELDTINALLKAATDALERIPVHVSRAGDALREPIEVAEVQELPGGRIPPRSAHESPSSQVTARRVSAPQRTIPPGSSQLSGPEQRILDALAELEAIGVEQAERIQVALFAGYTHLASKGFANGMGRLHTGGLIAYPAQGMLALTDEGRAAANPIERPRTTEELHERVIGLIGGAAARILRPLLEAYPESCERADVMAAAGYTHAASKGFANALGRLRSLGLIDYPAPGRVVALPVLFLEQR